MLSSAYETAAEKVRQYATMFVVPADKRRRIACRYLFSSLSHLERIAVLAAERGDCIEGQLEDEIFHRDLFAAIAELCGGLEEPDVATADLIEFLQGIEGAASLAVLNVVAEGWLETVFHALCDTEISPELFAAVEEDEHRHNHDARLLNVPDRAQSEPLIRAVEERLFRISQNPQFMLPLHYLMGAEAVSAMGMSIARAHESACKHLGVEPKVQRLRAFARANRILARTAPIEIEMTQWERSRFTLWDDVAPQIAYMDVRVPTTNPSKIQLLVLKSLGRVLLNNPELRRVARNERLYEPQRVTIGLRATHRDRNQVFTIYVDPNEYPTSGKLLRAINCRKRTVNDHEYIGIPRLGDLVELLPPARAICTLSSNGAFGGLFGTGPLNRVEGVPMSVTIGEVQTKPYWDGEKFAPVNVVTLGAQLDHRANDGLHLGLLASELKRLIESC